MEVEVEVTETHHVETVQSTIALPKRRLTAAATAVDAVANALRADAMRSLKAVLTRND